MSQSFEELLGEKNALYYRRMSANAEMKKALKAVEDIKTRIRILNAQSEELDEKVEEWIIRGKPCNDCEGEVPLRSEGLLAPAERPKARISTTQAPRTGTEKVCPPFRTRMKDRKRGTVPPPASTSGSAAKRARHDSPSLPASLSATKESAGDSDDSEEDPNAPPLQAVP